MMKKNEIAHSGLGVSAFVIGMAVAIFEFVLLIVAGVVVITGQARPDAINPTLIINCILTGIGISCFCLGLSLGGLLQENRKKLFSILGLSLNLTVVAVMVGLIFFTAIAA